MREGIEGEKRGERGREVKGEGEKRGEGGRDTAVPDWESEKVATLHGAPDFPKFQRVGAIIHNGTYLTLSLTQTIMLTLLNLTVTVRVTLTN